MKPIKTPPMFQRSWTLLLQERPALLPVALWKRVLANTTLPPYLVWAVDKERKDAARDSIVNAVLDAARRQMGPERPADAAIVNAVAEGTGRGLSTRDFNKLSKQIVDVTRQNAARFQIPPSALDEIAQQAIAKIGKG